MIKSCSGIFAALAVLFCCSQADAKAPTADFLKLMADRPGAQGPEWVLYEDLPEDGEIVSFNQAGDNDGAFEICQSEDGAVGTITETTQGGLVCRTASGAEESFYVLQLAEGVEDDGEAGGLAAKFHKKHGTGHDEESSANHFRFMLFDWNEEELKEIIVALGETDAAKRMIEECADPSEEQMEVCGISDKKSAWRGEEGSGYSSRWGGNGSGNEGQCDHWWCNFWFEDYQGVTGKEVRGWSCPGCVMKDDAVFYWCAWE